MSVGEWLNHNAGAVQAIATVLLAGFTLTYVWLVRGTLRTARESLRSERMPVILGDKVDASGPAERPEIKARLSNPTPNPAINVRVDIYQADRRLGGVGPFATWDGQRTDRISVGTFHLDKSQPYEVVVKYWDLAGNTYRTRRVSKTKGQSSISLEAKDAKTGKTRTLIQGETLTRPATLGKLNSLTD